jgi:microcystin-dependent protein
MVGFNFQVNGWAFCNGQIMSIAQNDTLFNLIGTTYGGDGQQTFALPDLQGRFAVHQGASYGIGQRAGAETVTLNMNQMPLHGHYPVCSPGGGNLEGPVNAYWATDPFGNTAAYNESGGTAMATSAIGPTGQNQPHDNMHPFLAINFIISLFGVFPSQG